MADYPTDAQLRALGIDTSGEWVGKANADGGAAGLGERGAYAVAAAIAYLPSFEWSANPQLMRSVTSWEDGEPAEYTIDHTAEVVHVSDSPGFGTKAVRITPGDLGAGFWLNSPAPPGFPETEARIVAAGVPLEAETLYTVHVAARRVSATQADDDGFFFGVECCDEDGAAVTDFATRDAGSNGRDQAGDPVDGTGASYVDYLVNGELDPATDPDVWNVYTFNIMTTADTVYGNFEIGSSNGMNFMGNVDAVWEFDALGVWKGTNPAWRP